MVGFAFYIRTQLKDFQNILQTAQCSTTIIQQHLKSNLLEFLCLIRAKLIIFRAIEELKYISDQVNDVNTSNSSGSTNVNNRNDGQLRPQSSSGEMPSIGFSHLYNDVTIINKNNLSPGNSYVVI